jgi:hypothetical protein
MGRSASFHDYSVVTAVLEKSHHLDTAEAPAIDHFSAGIRNCKLENALR